jgi:ribosomal protein S18 acetylase RimI-like enzyme
MSARFGGAILADGRCFRFRSGLTSGFTNGVLQTTVTPEAVPSLIEEVRAWFPRGTSWVWLVSALDRPTDLAARLATAGFQRRRVLSAMTRDLAGFDVAAAFPVDVCEIRDSADLEAWLTVRNANHPLNEATRDAWLRTQPTTAHPAFRQFVARAGDGRPGGSTTLFLDGATAGIYHVDVVPEARGRGIGKALTRAALGAAMKAGARQAVLTATELGVALYRSLGFALAGEVEVLVGV